MLVNNYMSIATTFFYSILIALLIIPFNYLLDIEFNPIYSQLFFFSILIFPLKKNISNNNIFLVILILFFSAILSKFSSSTLLSSLVFSNIIFSIGFLLIKWDEDYFYSKTILKFFVAISFLLIFYYLFINQKVNYYGRLKGFGSGTLSSIICALNIIILLNLNKLKKISFMLMCALCTLFVYAIFQFESRGVLISLIFIIIYIYFKKFKIKYFSVLIFLVPFLLSFLFLIFNKILYQSNIYQRFNVDNFANFNDFTSGRFNSINEIVEKVFNYNNFTDLVLGFGFNSIDELVEKGYELPHFDIFYILFEGGLLLLIIYLFFLKFVYNRFYHKELIFLYILCSFHTNLLTTPAFIFALFACDNLLKKYYNS